MMNLVCVSYLIPVVMSVSFKTLKMFKYLYIMMQNYNYFDHSLTAVWLHVFQVVVIPGTAH